MSEDIPGSFREYSEKTNKELTNFVVPSNVDFFGFFYRCSNCGQDLARIEIHKRAAISFCSIKCRKCQAILDIKDLIIQEEDMKKV